MKVRKFIHDPMKLYDEACRIIEERAKHEPDFVLRVTVVKAILGGMRSADEVRQKDACEVGFDVWESDSLSEYINETYGIGISSRTACRIMERLNYTQQRPQIFPSKGHEDCEAREAFKQKRKEVDEDSNLIAVYQDESHLQQQTRAGLGWYKKGSKPKIPSYPGKASCPVSGFVIPSTGELFVTYPERFNTMSFIASLGAFLKKHPPPEGKKYALFMDNASWHKAAKRILEDENRTEFKEIRDKIKIIMLPPYSPDLNPIEQVWRLVRKRHTNNRFFRTVAALKEKLDEVFTDWSVPNQQLRDLCDWKHDEADPAA